MARENRRDNRAMAKAPKPGAEYEELLEEVYEDEDLQPDLFEEDASESESIEESVTPSNVDNQGEVDRSEEEVVSAQKPGGEENGEEVTEGEPEPESEPEEEEEVTEPATTEPTPTEEQPPASVARDAPETLTNEQAAELFTNWRSTTEDLLAENHYKLSDEDIQMYEEDPAKLVSRMASRVYLDSISAAFQQFVTYLPRMVDQVLVQREASSRQEDSFFGAWPELKGHQDVVVRLGRAYRTQNPAASVDDFINEVGAQAMVALRLTPKGRGNGAPKPQAKAFKPASNAPANERIPSRKPLSPWEALTEEFSVDEEEMDDN